MVANLRLVEGTNPETKQNQTDRTQVEKVGIKKVKNQNETTQNNLRAAREAGAITAKIAKSKIAQTEKHARCNVNHSGNHRLTYALRARYECAGCGAFFTIDQIESAKANPSEFTGAGGVIWSSR